MSDAFAALLAWHGHDTVSVQGLGPGFQRWLAPDGSAAVAYVDTGGAWVAAGSPLAAPAQLAEAAEAFAAAALLAGRRASFFAAEQPLVDAGLRATAVGEQPVWHAARWPEILASASSLRYQLSRARHKGVTVRAVRSAELADGAPLRAQIVAVAEAWQAQHGMPPMRFLVNFTPFADAERRLVLVAERAGEVVGLASALPIAARDRMFVEHFVRAPDAPNGTIELLVDGVMQRTHTREVTLGLAPLAGAVPRWLRIARWLGTPLYDFAGLRAFKAKLRPHAWEPIYLCVPGGASTLVALRDTLRAFAGGSLLGFGAASLLGRRSAAAS
jgi:lysylphosphatidylglycerol synthetase-like protein (DUF2156 family)